jgi:agmatinase
MDSLYLNRNLVLEPTSTLQDADYVILGIPFDSTSTHRPGSREAPLEIRKEFLELEKDVGGGKSVFDVKYYDAGNVEVVPGNAVETLGRVEEVVRDLIEVNDNARLMVFGGEHLMTLGVVRALKAKDFTVLSIDAHLDLRDEYMGEKLNHSTVMRRITEEGVEVKVVGARSMSDEEVEYAESSSIEHAGVKDYKKILRKLKDKNVYMSMDFDVLEPIHAPGVGNPEPDGLEFNNIDSVIDYLHENCSVVGFDFMEVSPPYDTGATAVYAARAFIQAMIHDERP